MLFKEKPVSRRNFLKMAGWMAASALVAGGCTPGQTASQGGSTGAAQGKTLKIGQQVHFVPAYDEWFLKDFSEKWGQQNGVTVTVDFIPSADLYSLAAGDVAMQAGHDLFAFVSPPSAFEMEAVNLQDVVTDLESKFGPISPIVKQSVYNPKTKKYFALADHYVPAPPVYRKDLWETAEAGSVPDKWEDILRVGRKLKKMGSPVGIGISPEMDTNTALRGLLYSYGATEMDENGRVTINSPRTIETLKLMASLYSETMTREVLSWSASSNNQFLLSGTGSLVINAISVIRTAEKTNPELAKNMAIWKAPAGPVRRVLPTNIVNSYCIWQYSPVIDLAKKFLVDLISSASSAFTKSEMYNIPSFPGAAPGFKDLYKQDAAADPADKYALLATAGDWMTNFGDPGFTNAAISESLDTFLLVRMFANVATGQMKPEEAAQWADMELTRIAEKWKARGLV